MALVDKIQYSIDLLKQHEATALNMNPEGYYVAFSGGKDSQVIYELCKMAKVKFKAHFSCTTIDPKEVLRFIHQYYPDVIWHRPEKSIFKLIEEKSWLPLRNFSFCCRLIKEVGGVGYVTITGIRKYESRNRMDKKESYFSCVGGIDKIVINPILNWTNNDVWTFIKRDIGYWCPLYDMGYRRVGCVGCPKTTEANKRRDLKTAPRFEYAYKKAIKKCMDKGSYSQFEDENDVFNWWIQGISMKKYFANKQQGTLEL